MALLLLTARRCRVEEHPRSSIAVADIGGIGRASARAERVGHRCGPAVGSRGEAGRSRASLARSRGTCRRPVVFREPSQTWPMNSPVSACWTKYLARSQL